MSPNDLLFILGGIGIGFAIKGFLMRKTVRGVTVSRISQLCKRTVVAARKRLGRNLLNE